MGNVQRKPDSYGWHFFKDMMNLTVKKLSTLFQMTYKEEISWKS